LRREIQRIYRDAQVQDDEFYHFSNALFLKDLGMCRLALAPMRCGLGRWPSSRESQEPMPQPSREPQEPMPQRPARARSCSASAAHSGGPPHDKILEAIRLFGERVLPYV
jgi:hypothetical protein